MLPKNAVQQSNKEAKQRLKLTVAEKTHKSTAFSLHGIVKKHVSAIQHLGRGTATLEP